MVSYRVGAGGSAGPASGGPRRGARVPANLKRPLNSLRRASPCPPPAAAQPAARVPALLQPQRPPALQAGGQPRPQDAVTHGQQEPRGHHPGVHAQRGFGRGFGGGLGKFQGMGAGSGVNSCYVVGRHTPRSPAACRTPRHPQNTNRQYVHTLTPTKRLLIPHHRTPRLRSSTFRTPPSPAACRTSFRRRPRCA